MRVKPLRLCICACPEVNGELGGKNPGAIERATGGPAGTKILTPYCGKSYARWIRSVSDLPVVRLAVRSFELPRRLATLACRQLLTRGGLSDGSALTLAVDCLDDLAGLVDRVAVGRRSGATQRTRGRLVASERTPYGRHRTSNGPIECARGNRRTSESFQILRAGLEPRGWWLMTIAVIPCSSIFLRMSEGSVGG